MRQQLTTSAMVELQPTEQIVLGVDLCKLDHSETLLRTKRRGSVHLFRHKHVQNQESMHRATLEIRAQEQSLSCTIHLRSA